MRDTEVDLKVTRIVYNIQSQDPARAQGFYGDLLGLDLMMDLGWIRTYGSMGTKPIEISVLSEGGSGAPTPELSIEVDDFDQALRRMTAAKMPIEYGPANEPWGVRRFYVRDPFGKLINVLAHS